jgi:glucose-1-phosphate thymidylyltransferase
MIMRLTEDQLVGIIPAAGKGSRIAPLPGSKEVFPIGFSDRTIEGVQKRCPKVVSQYLIDRMIVAGVTHIHIVISEGKWDIMRYYGDGTSFGVNISYLLVEEMIGMPFTLNIAFPWVRGATVIFGMPDTIFKPIDAFSQMLTQHRKLKSDLTLGLFPTDQPWRLSMVKFDEENRVVSVTDKPTTSELRYTWGCGCWGVRFTELLNHHLQERKQQPGEVVLADYFNMAIADGLTVRALAFNEGEYIDIGSPQDLESAVKLFNQSDPIVPRIS